MCELKCNGEDEKINEMIQLLQKKLNIQFIYQGEKLLYHEIIFERQLTLFLLEKFREYSYEALNKIQKDEIWSKIEVLRKTIKDKIEKLKQELEISNETELEHYLASKYYEKNINYFS